MVGGQTLVAGADGVDGRHLEGVHGEGGEIRHIVTRLRSLGGDGDNLVNVMFVIGYCLQTGLQQRSSNYCTCAQTQVNSMNIHYSSQNLQCASLKYDKKLFFVHIKIKILHNY